MPEEARELVLVADAAETREPGRVVDLEEGRERHIRDHRIAGGRLTGVAPNPMPAPPPIAVDPRHKVSNPKNYLAVTNPCDVLTPWQLRELGLGDNNYPAPDSWASYPRCDWGYGVHTNLYIGLDVIWWDRNTARHRSRTAAELIGDGRQVHRIDGYPADIRPGAAGLCRLSVAVADNQVLEIKFSRHDNADPCGYIERVASVVIKNLPPL